MQVQGLSPNVSTIVALTEQCQILTGWAARRVMGHSQAQVRTAVRGRWPATLSSGSTQSQDYLYSMSSLLVVVATGGVTLGWIIGVLLAQLISCSQTDMGIDSA